MNQLQLQNTIDFIEAARIVRFKPMCAITAHMINDDIERMTEDELVKEALELSAWLNNRQVAFSDKNGKAVFLGDDCTITVDGEVIAWGEVVEEKGSFFIQEGDGEVFPVQDYPTHIELA